MRFAVALLALICIASIIGTVIQQNQPAINYVNQFGPFWAEVFTASKLNTVYSSWWFLLILGFLVVSTSLCITRNTPKILRHLRDHKENLRLASFAAFGAKHSYSGNYSGSAEVRARELGEYLAGQGWRVKMQTRADGVMLAAKAGALSKLGYIAAHSAIVLICLGGLLDGDLLIKLQTWTGQKSVFQGQGFISQIPAEHRLSASNPSFRANLRVSEGTAASSAILTQTGGILIQDLPFSIELKKFIVEYYSTGAPKLFASDILIHDKATGQVTPARIEVNKPFDYKGNSIYQSSFEDGGSALTLEPLLLEEGLNAPTLQGRIGESATVALASPLTIEYGDLRLINVENFGQDSKATDVRAVNIQSSLDKHLGAANKSKEDPSLRNVGPKVQYKLRDSAGQALEFDNYMLPIQMADQTLPHFVFGVRSNPADGFRYLRVPIDSEGSAQEFARVKRALAKPELRALAAKRYAERSAQLSSNKAESKAQLLTQLQEATALTLDRFAGSSPAPDSTPETRAGLPAIARHIEARVPEAERAQASEYVLRMLAGSLFELTQLTRAQAGLTALPDNAQSQAYVAQMLTALSDVYAYPVPLIYTLKNFKQVQASVFQITRGPGKWVVYAGCIFLILGVLAMLYIREQRLWVWLGHDAQLRMAFSSNRHTLDADQGFETTRDALLKRVSA